MSWLFLGLATSASAGYCGWCVATNYQGLRGWWLVFAALWIYLTSCALVMFAKDVD